jgi:hypothetical protein
MGMVFTWLGVIDNTCLWRDAPRVCKRWAHICRVQAHGVRLTYQLFMPARCELPLDRIPRIINRMKVAARRHFNPKEVTICITGHKSAIQISRIAKVAADWITGLAINTILFEHGEDTCVDVDCVRDIIKHCPNLIRLGLVGMCPSSRRSYEYVPYNMHDFLLEEVCLRLPALRTLELSHWNLSSRAGVRHLANCPDLSSLTFGWRSMTTDATLAKIIQDCPKMSLSGICTGFHSDLASNADAFREGYLKTKWEIGCTDQITSAGVAYMVDQCPNITDFSLSFSLNNVLGTIADSKLRLTTLRLDGSMDMANATVCFSEQTVIKLLQTMHTLVHVELVECKLLTHKTLRALAATCGPQLTTLKIVSRHNDSMRGSFAALLERCLSLEHLELHETDGQIGEIELDVLTRSCSRLKTLVLDCSDQAKYPWTQYALDDLRPLHRLRQLRKLDIRRRTTNGPDTIGLLCGQCDWLTSIRLSGSAVQTQTDVAVIVATMAHLTELQVRSKLVLWSSSAGFEGCIAPLQKLSIVNAQSFRPAAATYILGKVHTLRRADFSGCYKLDGAFLRRLARSFPNVYIVHSAYQALGMAMYEDDGWPAPPYR